MSHIYLHKFGLSKPPQNLFETHTLSTFKTNYPTYNNGVNYAY